MQNDILLAFSEHVFAQRVEEMKRKTSHNRFFFFFNAVRFKSNLQLGGMNEDLFGSTVTQIQYIHNSIQCHNQSATSLSFCLGRCLHAPRSFNTLRKKHFFSIRYKIHRAFYIKQNPEFEVLILTWCTHWTKNVLRRLVVLWRLHPLYIPMQSHQNRIMDVSMISELKTRVTGEWSKTCQSASTKTRQNTGIQNVVKSTPQKLGT